jgi:lipoprotein-anchoring transpeptidase ErfK/SrfK
LLLAEIMKLSANIIIFYLAMLLPRSSLVSAVPFIPPAAPATPKVTAESQFITGAEAGTLTAGVATQVLGAAIDTTLLQVSGVVNGAVGLSQPPVITGENFQVVSTQLGNAQSILGSISGLSDTTGGQGIDFPTPIAFPVIPPP